MSDRRKLIIGVDLDDTLMPNTYLYHEPIWDCAKIISKALGIHSPYPPKLVNLQQEVDGRLLKTMKYSVMRFPLSWIKTYRQLARVAGVPVDPAVERQLFLTAITFTLGPFELFPAAQKALVTLRMAGHAVHLITAGDVCLQQFKIEETGLEPYFLPEITHITDVDKSEKMLEVFGPDPTNSVMVGDSLGSDIEAAQKLNLGIITVHVPSETWKFAGSVNKVQPDYTIRTIAELPALIEEIASQK